MLASFGGGYGDMIAACVVALQADSERAESREKAHERVNEWCCNEGFSKRRHSLDEVWSFRDDVFEFGERQ